MFDEFNEGNQIACTAEDASMIPVGSSSLYFTLDQDGTRCTSDYYLRLTGDGGKMLKGQIPLTFTRPTVPGPIPVVPPAPAGLTAAGGNAQVALTWAATPGAAGYSVKRATNSGGAYSLVATNVGMVSYSDTGLANGTLYYYAVSAVNLAGQGPDSAPAAAIPYAAVASASSQNSPTEGAAQAFDGLTSTKWYNAAGGTTGWLQEYLGGAAKVVIGYSLTSANDVPGRDPKNWQFQGSQNGTAWTTLDAQAGQTFASRFLTQQYAISNSTAYGYYRLNITANNGDANSLQQAELAFTFLNVALTAPSLSVGMNGGQLQFNWPADHTGWRLQSQTSGAAGGLGANWSAVAGSAGTNQVFVPVNPSGDPVFFRLVYP